MNKINEVIALQLSAGPQAGEQKIDEEKDELAKTKRSANKPEPVSDLFFDNLVVQK